MSLPIQAVNLHGDGNPWFPYRSEQEGAVRFTNHPTLPAGEDHRWCTVPDGFPHPALSLDLPNLANLMYLSQIPTEVLDETRVAGLDAGMSFNTWPLIDGALVPSSERLWFETPLWRNFFENTLTVQFDHRMLAYAIWLLVVVHAIGEVQQVAGPGEAGSSPPAR